jgi:hypothetical protein
MPPRKHKAIVQVGEKKKKKKKKKKERKKERKKEGNNSVGKKPSRRGIEGYRHCARELLHLEL